MRTTPNAQTSQVRRILMVEDEPQMRRLFSETLFRSGFQVDTAENGEAAWDALTSLNKHGKTYDLLITDNRMPKLSGVELVKKVRSARLALAVILASSELPHNVEWLQLAAVLPKPFYPGQLLQTVNEVLQQEPLKQDHHSLQL